MNQFADAAITEGVKPVLLCTLWASDIVVRLANTPTDVPDVLNATTYFYDAGLLEIEDFAEELDFYEMTSAGTIQQSNVKLVLPRSVSAIALDAQGLYLVGMEAEISMIWPGDDYANRRVLVARSIVGRPRFGIENAVLEFGLETVQPTDGAIVGDPARDMGSEHPTLGYGNLEGTQYPTIIGRVYRVPGYKIGLYSGASGPDLLVCGHRMSSASLVTNLAFYDDGEAYTPTGPLSLDQTADASGEITLVETDDADDFKSAELSGTHGTITLDLPFGAMRAVRASHRSAKSASEVIEYLLVASGQRIDWPRTYKTLDWFGDWDLGLYVSEAAPSLTLLKDRILPWIPSVLSLTADGLALLACTPWVQPPTFHFTDGQEVSLDQFVEHSDYTKCRNYFVLRYFYDSAKQDYTKTVTLGAAHPLAGLSQRMKWGIMQDETLSCNTCWSDATARKILEARASRMAMPRGKVTGFLDARYGDFEAGAVGLLTSERLGFTAKKVYIRRIQPMQNPIPVEFEFVPLTFGEEA